MRSVYIMFRKKVIYYNKCDELSRMHVHTTMLTNKNDRDTNPAKQTIQGRRNDGVVKRVASSSRRRMLATKQMCGVLGVRLGAGWGLMPGLSDSLV